MQHGNQASHTTFQPGFTYILRHALVVLSLAVCLRISRRSRRIFPYETSLVDLSRIALGQGLCDRLKTNFTTLLLYCYNLKLTCEDYK